MAKSSTSFQPGQSGNPHGRPAGARNKLTTRFVTDLLADFEQHGTAAIQAARTDDPTGYLRIIAGLLPKEVEVGKPGDFSDMNDDELRDYISREARALSLGATRAGQAGNGSTPVGKPH